MSRDSVSEAEMMLQSLPRKRSIAGAFSLTLLVGCGTAEGLPEESGPEERARVEVASPSGDGFAGVPTLRVNEQPLLSIGVLDGDEPYVFAGITDVMRQPSGDIVVANCATSELRFFDPTGEFVRSVGQRGQGPGEFMHLGPIFPANGDSVGAWDFQQRRITVFSPDGTDARTAQLQVPFSVNVAGRNVDGSFVAVRPEGYLHNWPSAPGIYRESVAIFRFDGTGVPRDSLVGLPGYELLIGEAAAPRALRLRRGYALAVFPESIVYGAQDSTGLVELGLSLDTVRIFKTVTQGEPVTPAIQQEWEDGRYLRLVPGGVSPAYGRAYASHMPAYQDIVAGTDGTLWVQDPIRPSTFALMWTAYSDGVPVYRAELPRRFFPTEFGAQYVLGVAYDEVSVERVILWELVPGELTGLALSPREAEPPAVPRCGAQVSRP